MFLISWEKENFTYHSKDKLEPRCEKSLSHAISRLSKVFLMASCLEGGAAAAVQYWSHERRKGFFCAAVNSQDDEESLFLSWGRSWWVLIGCSQKRLSLAAAEFPGLLFSEERRARPFPSKKRSRRAISQLRPVLQHPITWLACFSHVAGKGHERSCSIPIEWSTKGQKFKF